MRAIEEEKGTNRENRNLKELSKIQRGRDFCDTKAGERRGEYSIRIEMVRAAGGHVNPRVHQVL